MCFIRTAGSSVRPALCAGFFIGYHRNKAPVLATSVPLCVDHEQGAREGDDGGLWEVKHTWPGREPASGQVWTDLKSVCNRAQQGSAFAVGAGLILTELNFH